MHDHLEGHDKKPPQLFQIAVAPYQKPHDHHTKFLVGLDVGGWTKRRMNDKNVVVMKVYKEMRKLKM